MNAYHQFQVELAKRLIDPTLLKPIAENECSASICENSEQWAVESLSVDELDRSAETLIRKRISQTRYWLPKTSSYLGDRFAIAFREFAQGAIRGAGYSRQDAIEFANHLWKCHRNLPDWIADVAKWESLQCYRCEGPFTIRSILLRYDVASWLPFGPKLPRRGYRLIWVLRWGRWRYVSSGD